ncbi:MAG: LytR/AlgR family response regulator transcription factor [Bacteroidales bacterium]
MKIRTIAIDDEPPALELVRRNIEKTPFLELLGTFDNPLDSIDILSNNEVDLILLDIHMPDLTGVEFARSLQDGPHVIFTTAYDKYALEGFRLNVIDYLLKPFNYEEFLTAVQKAKKQIELERNSFREATVENRFLFLKSEYKIRRINFDDILYIEGLKDYVKVFLSHERKPVLSLATLKSLERALPAEQFMRVHKSYIVNLDQIQTIERYRIIFGEVRIPVSEQYKSTFNEFLRKNFPE